MPTNRQARTRARREPAGARREHLLDTALRLIAASGVDAITHRRVAAAAGVPLGSTTYYFDSREDLIREAFRRYIARSSAEVEELAAEVMAAPSAERLIDFLIALTEREFADEAVLITELELTLFAARDPVLAADLHRWHDGMVAELAEALEHLGAPAPFEAARTVIQLVRGYEQEGLTRRSGSPDELRGRLASLFRHFLPD